VKPRSPVFASLVVVLASCRAAAIPESQAFPAGTALIPKYVTVDSSRLRVLDVGCGPAVVLVHGLAASMYSWRYTIDPLVAAGYRVVAYDNRGFGFSDKPARGYSNAAYVHLLFGLLDSLGVSDAVLVGHSMGGAIVADAALARPDRVRGLVLVDAAGLGVGMPFMLRVARWPIVGPLFDHLRGRGATGSILRAIYGDASRVTERDIDQYYAPIALPDFGRGLRGILHEFSFDDLRGRLGSIMTPTLVMWGTRDRLIPQQIGEAMAAQLPHSSLARFPTAGHALPEESPEEFNRVLIGYLKSGLPAAPENLALGQW
jgi:pimeloyl-ACP methyl ester carboxylesterase